MEASSFISKNNVAIWGTPVVKKSIFEEMKEREAIETTLKEIPPENSASVYNHSKDLAVKVFNIVLILYYLPLPVDSSRIAIKTKKTKQPPNEISIP